MRIKFLFKVFKFLLWSTTFFTIITLITIYISFIYLPDKLYKRALIEEPYDVIIVPGVPFKDKWSDIMKTRVLWANHLYKKGIARHIIFSGSAVYTPYVESEIMALYAHKLGISKERIFTETRAEHSTENLYYSFQMAKKLGFKRVALATDPFQNLMLWNFVGKVSPSIARIPIKYKLIEDFKEKELSIDPTSAKVENFISLVERESFLERFKGTLGKKIEIDPN